MRKVKESVNKREITYIVKAHILSIIEQYFEDNAQDMVEEYAAFEGIHVSELLGPDYTEKMDEIIEEINVIGSKIYDLVDRVK